MRVPLLWVVVPCHWVIGSLSNWSVMFWRSSGFTFKGLEFQEENFKTRQNRSANVTVNFIARKLFCCNHTSYCVYLYSVITHAYGIYDEWIGNKDSILGRVRYSSPPLHPKLALGKVGGFFAGIKQLGHRSYHSCPCSTQGRILGILTHVASYVGWQ